jgi:probable rRNA maturation factor
MVVGAMEILINDLIDSSEVSEELLQFIKEICEEVMRMEDCESDAELSVALIDDEGIKELNSTYRGIDSPTDVLSFPQEDEHILGDIVISLETAKRQAIEGGHSFHKEMCILLIHGILHLIGYDHEEDGEAEEMEAREREIKIELKELFL